MKKTIIVISNPFGYGPTGKALSIISALNDRLKNSDVVYAGSGLGQEIADLDINTIYVNERDEKALNSLFKTIPNPHVISSQNRFAIKVANKLGIPNAFFDGLAWFWHQIPDEHFLADIVFFPRFPNISSISHPKINFVGTVVERVADIPRPSRGNIVITLGGMKNPLIGSLPFSYLDLFVYGINSLHDSSNDIIIVCNQETLLYLNEKISNKKVFIKNLKHKEFIKLLMRSRHLITTGGQTATTESFSLSVPVSFILPVNLSQYALVQLLKSNNACSQCLEWNSYVDVRADINDLSEKEAMIEFDIYASRILSETSLINAYTKDFRSMIQQIPENDGQKKFINNVGTNGAQEIVSLLIKKWDLQ